MDLVSGKHTFRRITGTDGRTEGTQRTTGQDQRESWAEPEGNQG